MANSVDSDLTPRSAASDQGLHCLQRPICPNTLVYYGMYSLCRDLHCSFNDTGQIKM